MKTQGLSKKQEQEAKQAKRVRLAEMDKAEYMLNSKPWNAEVSDIAQFDAWACTFYETFSNVNRQVWDVFARWKFINTLIDNGRLEKFEADGRILLLEVEEKSSDLEVESEVQEGQQS